MARSTHNDEYQALLVLLRELRERAGLTQAELAGRLGNTQTFVSKMERGERRIDTIEFIELCEALGTDPEDGFRELLLRCSPQIARSRKLSRRV